MGIVGVPGDRSDDLVVSAARAAAAAFPRVVLREDDDLRGRERGEVAEMMRSVIGASAPDVQVDVVHSALGALRDLMDDVAQGALVALFYEHLEEVVGFLDSVGAQQVEELPLEAAPYGRRHSTPPTPQGWKSSFGPS